MIKNEKGYVLVLSLAFITMVILICGSLITATYLNYKQSINSIENNKLEKKAILKAEVLSAEIDYYINNFSNEEQKKLIELKPEFYNYFDELSNNYDVVIRDLSKEPCKYQDKNSDVCYDISSNSYTLPFELVVEIDDQSYVSKQFFITALPSFLNFAAGSGSNLTLTGGSYIDGDIYAEDKILISNAVAYLKDKNVYVNSSNYPTITQSSYIFTNDNLFVCDNNFLPCYDENSNKIFLNDQNFEYLENISSIYNEPPSVLNYYHNFVDINLEKTIEYYLNQAGNSYYDITYKNIDKTIDSMIENGNLEEINDPNIGINDYNNSVVFDGNTKITSSIELDKNEWLIINGNLYLENDNDEPISINANVIVNGDLVITGNTSFNSTVYVNGQTTIYNSEIERYQNGQLILFSKEQIELSVINIYNNNFERSIKYLKDGSENPTYNPDIEGYFYTDSSAIIYGIGSTITIDGGIFANDLNNDFNENTNTTGLVINSYQGSANLIDGEIVLIPGITEEARVKIYHNNQVFIHQPKGLPLSEKMNVIHQKIKVSKY